MATLGRDEIVLRAEVAALRLLVHAPDDLPSFSHVAIDEVFHQQSLGFHLALCKRTSRLAPDFTRRVPPAAGSLNYDCAVSAL